MKHLTLLFSLALTWLAFASPTRGSLASRGASLSNAPEMPTAASYIQDGLVAIWDGIENVAYGEHDSSSTVWRDLINGCEATPHDGSSALQFNDTCVRFDGTCYLDTQAISNYNGVAYTIEIVNNIEDSAYLFLGAPYNITGWPKIICPIVRKNYGYQPCIINIKNYDTIRCSNVTRTFSNVLDGLSYKIYFNGTLQRTDTQGLNNQKTFHGQIGIGWNYRDKSLFFKGNIYCIRVYSRPLTDDEVVYNAAIDKKRFGL